MSVLTADTTAPPGQRHRAPSPGFYFVAGVVTASGGTSALLGYLGRPDWAGLVSDLSRLAFGCLALVAILASRKGDSGILQGWRGALGFALPGAAQYAADYLLRIDLPGFRKWPPLFIALFFVALALWWIGRERWRRHA